MTARVPLWAMVLMSVLLLSSLAIGLGSDAGVLHIPGFLLNLISSITAFSASGLFASSLVNRYVRNRYWGLELNRRVAASARIELIAAQVAEVLQLDIESDAFRDNQKYESLPERAVGRLRSAIEIRMDEIANAATPEDVELSCPVPIVTESAPWLGNPGDTIAKQLSFVSDAPLLHATDRLDVKLQDLRTSIETWRASATAADYSSLLRTGRSVTSAITEVIEWLVAAPNRTMRSLVREGLRDSEARPRRLLG